MNNNSITKEIIKLIVWIFCAWILWLLIFSILTPDEEEISDFLNNLSLYLGVITGIIISCILKYNTLNNLKQTIKANHSNIKILDTKSKKLLEKANKVSDKYMNHEKEVHKEISKNRIIKNSTQFQLLIENYPDLKSNEAILKLIEQIKENENSISNCKLSYNNNVSIYNTMIHNFPVSLVRNIFKIKDMEYYEEEEDIVSDEELGI